MAFARLPLVGAPLKVTLHVLECTGINIKTLLINILLNLASIDILVLYLISHDNAEGMHVKFGLQCTQIKLVGPCFLFSCCHACMQIFYFGIRSGMGLKLKSTELENIYKWMNLINIVCCFLIFNFIRIYNVDMMTTCLIRMANTYDILPLVNNVYMYEQV